MIAREESFNEDTWIGRNPDYFQHHSVWQQYIMALYFSVTVFTAMGDAAMYPYTVVEMAAMIVYLVRMLGFCTPCVCCAPATGRVCSLRVRVCTTLCANCSNTNA